jgi:hypothetical protein
MRRALIEIDVKTYIRRESLERVLEASVASLAY